MSMHFFDYDDGDFAHTLSDNMAIDSDGALLMRMGDNMAMDIDSGDIHFISSWEDEDDYPVRSFLILCSHISISVLYGISNPIMLLYSGKKEMQ